MAENIVQFSDISKEFRVAPNGVSYASIRGTARLAGVTDSTLVRQFQGADLNPSKLAEKLAYEGFKGADLVNFAEGIPDQAVAVILEYYAMDAGRNCTDQSKASYKAFAAIGIRALIWKVTGFEEVVTESPKLELPPPDVRVSNLANSLTTLGIDLTNPRYKQHIQDYAINLIVGHQLPPAEPQPVWVGVVEIAIDMGYSQALVNRFRSQLGKYVAMSELESRKEKRLCNGTQREINLYRDCEECRNVIAEFLDAKVLASTPDDL